MWAVSLVLHADLTLDVGAVLAAICALVIALKR
jgi:hypothetical protein